MLWARPVDHGGRKFYDFFAFGLSSANRSEGQEGVGLFLACRPLKMQLCSQAAAGMRGPGARTLLKAWLA